MLTLYIGIVARALTRSHTGVRRFVRPVRSQYMPTAFVRRITQIHLAE